jgi:hypothetical protein
MHRMAWVGLMAAFAACRPDIQVTPTPARDAPAASATATPQVAPRADLDARAGSVAVARAETPVHVVDPERQVRRAAAKPWLRCALGEVHGCMPRREGAKITAQMVLHGSASMCVATPDGHNGWTRCRETPLVVALDARPVELTRPDGAFAIGGSKRTEWVSAETPWLAMDRDGSGCIEDHGELFGADEGAANGFDKLARLDDHRDGRIDAADEAFARLVLWADRDQDRRCTPSELVPLRAAGVVALELSYTSVVPPVSGSYEGEHAGVAFRDARGALRRGRVVDVYLEAMP